MMTPSATNESSRREHYLFVTGQLAEASLRSVVDRLAQQRGFDYTIAVMPITVAALITPKWLARHLKPVLTATRAMVPGYCVGDLSAVEKAAGVPVELGPRDLRELPNYFGRKPELADYGDYNTEIIATIAIASRYSIPMLLARAEQLIDDGADVIGLGCSADERWEHVGQAVGALRDEGYRIALDGGDPAEVEAAVKAGVEIVRPVHSRNVREAAHWGCEVIAVPDVPGTLQGIEATVEVLRQAGVRHRVDPLLSPIGFGFASSLGRYLALRHEWPDCEMVMNLAALTERTDVDTAGIVILLMSFCEELGIRSVTTSTESNRTRWSVRQCDFARRLAHFAVGKRMFPRDVDPQLIMLHDAQLLEHGKEGLDRLAGDLKDPSYRIFSEGGKIHVVAAGFHVEGTDPYDLFEQLEPRPSPKMEPEYAFYLGYEMAKAAMAMNLGKNYRQDESLNWGMLTVRELTRLERRTLRMARRREGGSDDAEPAKGP
jgi:dihydropteroate synthase